MLKIAIDSGHGLNTSGKEVPSYIGMGKIKEWTLNDRITTKLITMLRQYEDVKVLRLDDPTGKADIPLKERSQKANNFKADICISNHHNAGIGGKNGGGLVIYRYPNSTKFTKAMQRLLYDCLIAETGLKGNRTSPLMEKNFHMVRVPKMAAVLIEHGFMDSRSDMKEVIKEDFSTKSARGIVKFLEKQYGIKKKVVVQPEKPSNEFYRVRKTWKDAKTQLGAFTVLSNAIDLAKKNKGYSVYDDGGRVVYPIEQAEPQSKEFLVKVEANGLNIRKGPSTSHGINGVIRDKGTYTIVETSGNWGRLKSGAGWISLDYTKRV